MELKKGLKKLLAVVLALVFLLSASGINADFKEEILALTARSDDALPSEPGGAKSASGRADKSFSGSLTSKFAYVSDVYRPGDFKLAADGSAPKIFVGEDDDGAVRRAANDLSADVRRVTGVTPGVVGTLSQAGTCAVIIGTIGKSSVIDGLISAGKLDAAGISGKWESFVIQVVANPAAGIGSALVIAGSDRRGTIYGIYDVSEQIGVSPWYYWADVATAHRDTLIIKKGTYQSGEPSVQYRGIFINDESNFEYWSKTNIESDKNIGPETYKLVFELLLRLKANFLWPAMHPFSDSFNTYPESARLADEEYGIVMGLNMWR